MKMHVKVSYICTFCLEDVNYFSYMFNMGNMTYTEASYAGALFSSYSVWPVL